MQRVGHELLSRSGLARDQHGADVRGQTADQREDLLHRRAAPEHLGAQAAIRAVQGWEEQRRSRREQWLSVLVHDLKNLVAQLSLLLSNADKHKHKAEFQEDMVQTVSHSVDKMKRLLNS